MKRSGVFGLLFTFVVVLSIPLVGANAQQIKGKLKSEIVSWLMDQVYQTDEEAANDPLCQTNSSSYVGPDEPDDLEASPEAVAQKIKELCAANPILFMVKLCVVKFEEATFTQYKVIDTYFCNEKHRQSFERAMYQIFKLMDR